MLDDDIANIIREVGEAEVVSRFRQLTAGDVVEKTPGDLVTIADRECERVLSDRLRQIRDLPVVGEEATAADPTLLDLVGSAPAVWVVDPVDGTSNFVAGNENYVVMVSLVERGVTTHAWVWHPATDRMLSTRLGDPTRSNGVPIAPASRESRPSGILKRKYVPEPGRSQLGDFPSSIGTVVSAFGSAGIEYGALIDGTIDFLMYWRTLPWDHAPGALLAQQAGMQVGRIDGTEYVPGDGGVGLLAATPDLWPVVAAEIRECCSIRVREPGQPTEA